MEDDIESELEPDITLSLLPPILPGRQALLLVSYGQSNLVFQLEQPEQLARWVAFLLQHRDQPHPSSAPLKLEVGRYGPYPVEFSLEGKDMVLITAVLDHALDVEVATALGVGPMEMIPSLCIYIPRDLLDQLADGLAREHRQWVELPAP